jgi:hypothetical protein
VNLISLLPVLVLAAAPDRAASAHKPEPWEMGAPYPRIVQLHNELERRLANCHPSRLSVLDAQGRRGPKFTPDEKRFAKWAAAVEVNFGKYQKQQAAKQARQQAKLAAVSKAES